MKGNASHGGPTAGKWRPRRCVKFRRQAEAIRALMSEAGDLEDPAFEHDYYAPTTPVIEWAICMPADELADLEVMALAVAWCLGGLGLPPRRPWASPSI